MAIKSLAYSHLDTLAVTLSLSALPAPVTGFGTLLMVDTLASSTLTGFGSEVTVGSNGSKYVEIGGYSDATAANTASAGSVSAALLQDLQGLFGHSRSPATVKLLAVDLVGGDNLTDIYGDLDNAGYTDWYCAVPVSHALADIADIAQGVVNTISTTRERVIAAQTGVSAAIGNESGWDATDVGLLSETVRDRVFQIYYNGDTQPAAAGAASFALSVDPDTRSAPWTFPVPGISTMSFPSGTTIATAKTNLRANNINVPLPLGSTDVWLDAGVSLTGRPFYSIETADWFKARLQEGLQTLKVKYGSLLRKLPLNTDGQAIILGLIEKIYQNGVTADHFLSRSQAEQLGVEVIIRAEAITSTDRANRRLRFTVSLPVLLDARIINIEVSITQ